MPRQTAAQYYHVHQQLRRFWLTHQGLFAELTPTDQWLLHDYFQPGKDLTKDELLRHRAEISKQRPGLPQQAGRAYAKFQERAASWAVHAVRSRASAPPGRKSGNRRHHRIQVKAVVRPEIDPKRLARTLLDLAAERQRAKADDDAEPLTNQAA